MKRRLPPHPLPQKQTETEPPESPQAQPSESTDVETPKLRNRFRGRAVKPQNEDQRSQTLNKRRRILLPKYTQTYPKRKRDTGLQPQRTTLSWFRTAFSIFVNSLLLLRIGAKEDVILVTFCGWFFMFLSIWLYYASVYRGDAILTEKTLTTAASINTKKLISMTILITCVLLTIHFLSSVWTIFSTSG